MIPRIREFQTGATRDTEEGKIDPEGFLSPHVILRYSQYMHRHRHQADGGLRDSDNWQKGIPKNAYMKSMWRHFLDVWLHHRGRSYVATETLEDALCGIIFNASGYLHELLQPQLKGAKDDGEGAPRARPAKDDLGKAELPPTEVHGSGVGYS